MVAKKRLRTKSELDDALLEPDSGLTVILFYTKWCAPCLKLAPALCKLAEQYHDIGFYEVDCEDGAEELLSMIGPTSALPTALLYRGRMLLETLPGVGATQLQTKVKLAHCSVEDISVSTSHQGLGPSRRPSLVTGREPVTAPVIRG